MHRIATEAGVDDPWGVVVGLFTTPMHQKARFPDIQALARSSNAKRDHLAHSAKPRRPPRACDQPCHHDGMRVIGLWRYPVKSLQGERLDAAELTTDGIAGDRRYAIFDATTGLGLTGRRLPELLFAAARVRNDGTAEITLPDGSIAADDAALSRWLGRPVHLRSADDQATRQYENPEDTEHESQWRAFTGAQGAFHDSSNVRVSLVSTTTLGVWDPRRFRSNVLLDGAGEDALVGEVIRLGDAVMHVGTRVKRCVMTTRPQPGGIVADPDVLRTIARERDACLAIGALVAQSGVVRVGDEVTHI
jgi:uncharacterized protein